MSVVAVQEPLFPTLGPLCRGARHLLALTIVGLVVPQLALLAGAMAVAPLFGVSFAESLAGSLIAVVYVWPVAFPLLVIGLFSYPRALRYKEGESRTAEGRRRRAFRASLATQAPTIFLAYTAYALAMPQVFLFVMIATAAAFGAGYAISCLLIPWRNEGRAPRPRSVLRWREPFPPAWSED